MIVQSGNSCCSCTSCWFLYLCNLLTSPHNLIPRSVFEVLTFFVFILSSLPDFDFHTTTNDSYSHRREQIVSSVRMVIDTTIEHGSSILANARANHSLTTRMVFDEGRDIMDDTSNCNETATVLTLINVLVPFHDWQLFKWYTPIKCGTFL